MELQSKAGAEADVAGPEAVAGAAAAVAGTGAVAAAGTGAAVAAGIPVEGSFASCSLAGERSSAGAGQVL